MNSRIPTTELDAWDKWDVHFFSIRTCTEMCELRWMKCFVLSSMIEQQLEKEKQSEHDCSKDYHFNLKFTYRMGRQGYLHRWGANFGTPLPWGTSRSANQSSPWGPSLISAILWINHRCQLHSLCCNLSLHFSLYLLPLLGARALIYWERDETKNKLASVQVERDTAVLECDAAQKETSKVKNELREYQQLFDLHAKLLARAQAQIC